MQCITKLEYQKIIENLTKCKRLCCEISENKRNIENAFRILENLKIQETFYVIKNV